MIKVEFPQLGTPRVIFIIIFASYLVYKASGDQLIKAPLNGAFSPKTLWQFLFILELQLIKQINSFHVTSVICCAFDGCLWSSGVVKNVPTHEGLWKPSAQTAIYLLTAPVIKPPLCSPNRSTDFRLTCLQTCTFMSCFVVGSTCSFFLWFLFFLSSDEIIIIQRWFLKHFLLTDSHLYIYMNM